MTRIEPAAVTRTQQLETPDDTQRLQHITTTTLMTCVTNMYDAVTTHQHAVAKIKPRPCCGLLRICPLSLQNDEFGCAKSAQGTLGAEARQRSRLLRMPTTQVHGMPL
jgi:hypothetical protein